MSINTFEALLGSDPEVKKHFENTPTTDETAYIGKEHFWMLLADEELTQNQATLLYQATAFPWLRITRPAHQRSYFPIDPAELGIEVANRQDVGMRNPPFVVSAGMRNTSSTRFISRHQAEFSHAEDDISRVIRIGSFINFASTLRGNGFIEGRPTSIKLGDLGTGGVKAAELMSNNLQLCLDKTG